MRILLKTLTEKSIIQGGINSGMKVGDLLQKGRLHLIYAYFHYANITFTDEILDKLNIYPEDRLQKPAKNPDKFPKYEERNCKKAAYFHLNKKMNKNEYEASVLTKTYAQRYAKGVKKAKYKGLIEREKKQFSRAAMQRRNQGH